MVHRLASDHCRTRRAGSIERWDDGDGVVVAVMMMVVVDRLLQCWCTGDGAYVVVVEP